MERQLQEDLLDALDGLDPLELLIQDPELASVAEAVFSLPVADTESSADILPYKENNNNLVVAYSTGNSANSPKEPYESNKTIKSEPCVESGTNKKQKESGNACKVCNQVAKGHYHYGALVCTSCRAFFTRATKNGSFEDFVCVSEEAEGNCLIDSRSYRACKKCRFSKCLLSGMKIPAKYNSSQFGLYTNLYPYVHNLRGALAFGSGVTTEERLFLRDLCLKRFRVVTERRARFMTRDLEVYRQSIERFYGAGNFSLSTFKSFEDFMVYGQVEAFAEVGELADSLTRKDRTRLLTSNFALGHEFFEAYRLGIVPMKERTFSQHLDVLLKHLGDQERDKFDDVKRRTLDNRKLDKNNIR